MFFSHKCSPITLIATLDVSREALQTLALVFVSTAVVFLGHSLSEDSRPLGVSNSSLIRMALIKYKHTLTCFFISFIFQ